VPSDDCRFPNYSAFQPLFEGVDGVPVPLYLTLLDLGDGCEVALAQVRRILEGNADLTAQVVALLDGFDWRPHLVGAAAMGMILRRGLGPWTDGAVSWRGELAVLAATDTD